MRRNIMVITILALAFVLVGATSAQEDASECQHVGGTFIINFVDQTTAIAALTGDLEGAVRGVIVEQTSDEGGTLQLQLEHVVTTEDGDTIRTEDLATLTPVVDEIFLFQQTQTIVGGTGQYENATGTLVELGAVDFSTGQGVLRYSGEICIGS